MAVHHAFKVLINIMAVHLTWACEYASGLSSTVGVTSFHRMGCLTRLKTNSAARAFRHRLPPEKHAK
jgi:hypothetical protein